MIQEFFSWLLGPDLASAVGAVFIISGIVIITVGVINYFEERAQKRWK